MRVRTSKATYIQKKDVLFAFCTYSGAIPLTLLKKALDKCNKISDESMNDFIELTDDDEFEYMDPVIEILDYDTVKGLNQAALEKRKQINEQNYNKLLELKKSLNRNDIANSLMTDRLMLEDEHRISELEYLIKCLNGENKNRLPKDIKQLFDSKKLTKKRKNKKDSE